METSTVSDATDTDPYSQADGPRVLYWTKSPRRGVPILSERVPLGFLFLTVLMLIADAIIALLTEFANSRGSAMQKVCLCWYLRTLYVIKRINRWQYINECTFITTIKMSKTENFSLPMQLNFTFWDWKFYTLMLPFF
jgi:hypothetical protein